MTHSAAYWRKRNALLMYDRMEGAEEISTEIAEIYRTAYNQLANDMADIFSKYEQSYGLNDKEAMRLLNTMTNPADIEELKRRLATVGTDEAKQIKAMLDAPGFQRKLARFQAIQDEVNDISTNIYKQDLSKQRRWYTGLCRDTYNQTMYDIQREVGYGFSFSHIDDKLIRRVMASRWDGAGYSARLWSNVDGLAKEVQKQLTWGLITGKTERRMAAEIANKYAVGAFESRRLIRTESCYLSNEIQFKAYEEAGADRYMYIATLDSKTDEECGALDRRIFYVKDKQPGLNCPPMHPFCRCTTKIYIDQDTRADMKRRAKDPETGKYKLVPASMSYTEWKAQNNIKR